MNNESGFVLPYVLFIITIVFIVITTSISMYKREVEMSDHFITQLKIETLIQMSHQKLKEDYSLLELDSTNAEYIFIDGMVKLVYKRLDEELYRLQFYIETETGYSYTVTSTMRY